jgi:hypothetical protein
MFDSRVDGDEAKVKQIVPLTGSLTDFNVYLDSSPGGPANKSYTFTVRKDPAPPGASGGGSADTQVQCQISGSAITCEDNTNCVDFTAGDLISIKSQPSNNPARTPMRWTAVFTVGVPCPSPSPTP